MMLEIRDRHTGKLLASIDVDALRNTSIEGARVDGAILVSADLRNADLDGAQLWKADLSDADLEGASLNGAMLISSNLRAANLAGASLNQASLGLIQLQDANLERASLASSTLYDADLTGRNLTGADLTGAELHGANFEQAHLTGTILHGALYNTKTRWPEGFDPASHGAVSWEALQKSIPAEVYPEYRVCLEPVSQGEQAVASSVDAGRTKLGGLPDWIYQGEEWPACPGCSGNMNFIAQIDSIDCGKETDGPFIFSDCGMIYVFYCHECDAAVAVVQFH